MSGVSEGETHVAAMRLVCQSLEDHERQGIEIQWDVLQQQLDHMDVILQGITDQRNDDADEIQTLRQQLDAARSDNVEIRKRLNEETNRHRATNAEKIELFEQKEWANQHNAELLRERDAALAAVSLQRAGIERLKAFVGKVRNGDVLQALAELEAETSEPEEHQ